MTDRRSRRRLLSAIGAGTATIAGCVTLPGESEPSETGPSDAASLGLEGAWPSFGADARNTGHVSAPGPDDPAVDWTFETTNQIYDGVAVADGTVLGGSTDGNLYALDATAGEERWRFPVRGQLRTTPAIAGDLVFVGGRSGGLYALELESGEQRWDALDAAEFSRSDPTVVDGTLYAGSGEATLHALDARSGDEAWQHELDGAAVSGPAVADGTIYVGWPGKEPRPGEGEPGGVTAVSTDGELQWEIRRPDVDGTPTVVDDTVYVGGGSTLYALDAATGEERWTFETGGSTSNPSVADGTVYVGSFDTNLYAVDAATGEEEWRFETVKWANNAPAVADGTVYLSSWDTRVYAVDADSGEKRWSVTLETPLSEPAVAEDSVYVATENTLVALRDG